MGSARLIATLLGLAVARLDAQCPDGSEPPCTRRVTRPAPTPPAASARARAFLFLPFRNITRRPEHDWLMDGAPIMLGQSLGQFRDLNVVSDEQLSAARRRLRIAHSTAPDAAQIRQLANETGGWTAVSGTVIATGPRVRISLTATDVPTGQVIVRAQHDALADADLRATFDSLTVRLLEPAGIPPTGASLIALTTRSVEAYRAYLRGLAHHHRSEFRAAYTAFSEAVRLDSTFALGWSSLGFVATSARGFQEMVNPRSIVFQALDQATRHATNLPADHATLVRAMQLFLRAQLSQGQRLADSLVDAQPENVSALEIATMLYGMGAFISQRRETMSADVNRAIHLTSRVLEADPGRRMVYGVPAVVYGMAGGLFWGETWLETRPFTSMPFMLMAATANPQERFIPLLGDSLYFMPADSFRVLPDTVRRQLRRRGADRAMRWVEQWLAVGPGDSDAHLWASRIAELQGNHARALREFRIADSLGIQTGVENAVGRRLSLLVLNRLDEPAADLADSLLVAGAMDPPPLIPTVDRRWNYGAAALLLARRWDSAARLAQLINARRNRAPVCEALGYEIAVIDPLPSQLREQIMEVARTHIDTFRMQPILASCEHALTTGLNTPP